MNLGSYLNCHGGKDCFDVSSTVVSFQAGKQEEEDSCLETSYWVGERVKSRRMDGEKHGGESMMDK